jgi:2-keto-4-pentenoate hydratase
MPGNHVDQSKIEAAAGRLLEAATSRTPCAPVRDLIGESDVDAAYAVQERLTADACARGRHIVGYKIGLTSRAVQKQLGVGQPDYGILFADMDVPCGDDIVIGEMIAPRCEAEIALIMGDDLNDVWLTSADILASIQWVVPAIEIVDSRIANWDIRITDTIADNGSSGRYVLGHDVRRIDRVDLIACGMVLERRGEPVSTGAGIACLGSPINATLWLAKAMVRAGRPLKRGDVVLSGALGPMIPAAPGDVFEAAIEGVGRVSVGFAGQTT